MTDNFEETVNLKEKLEAEKNKKISSRIRNSRINIGSFAGQIDQIYSNKAKEKKELQKINKPLERKINEPILKRIVILLAVGLIGFVVYFLFFNQNKVASNMDNINWYSVKLVDGEIFYGQIEDITSDPIVIKNAYYNYDQQKNNNEVNKSNSLRLVKRGQETHGPNGTLNVVRMQILYMEPLKDDSKVLNAILNYEK